jgi:hypothetical protein
VDDLLRAVADDVTGNVMITGLIGSPPGLLGSG